MKISTTKLKKYSAYLLSIIILLVGWFIIALKVDADLIIPKPGSVFLEILNLLKSKKFWIDFLHTFSRILLSFLFCVVAGSILGYFSGTVTFVRHFLEIPLSILRSTPVIAVILIALFWFPSGFVPIFVSILMTLPIMITNVSESFCSVRDDSPLMKMSRLYGFSKFQNFFYIKLPAAKRLINAGLISCFGLTWKVVIAGEVLCLPGIALGSQLHDFQVHLETNSLIAVTTIYVVFSFIIEKIFALVLKLWEEKYDFKY